MHTPGIELVGISTVHGNGSLEHTTCELAEVGVEVVTTRLTLHITAVNAARLVCSFASPDRASATPIYSGAVRPLLRPVKHDTGTFIAGVSRSMTPTNTSALAEIHGDDGLGGVEGLLDGTDAAVAQKVLTSTQKNVVEAMAEAARAMPGGDGDEGRLAIVATGTLTNVALFCATYPDLVKDKVSQIVLMGGAEGRGNRSPTGEFNIICDPEVRPLFWSSSRAKLTIRCFLRLQQLCLMQK